MPNTRLASLLKDASEQRLLDLAQQRIDANDALLNGHNGLGTSDATGPEWALTSEMRRYLEGFDTWLRNPTEENDRIRRSRLLCMLGNR